MFVVQERVRIPEWFRWTVCVVRISDAWVDLEVALGQDCIKVSEHASDVIHGREEPHACWETARVRCQLVDLGSDVALAMIVRVGGILCRMIAASSIPGCSCGIPRLERVG